MMETFPPPEPPLFAAGNVVTARAPGEARPGFSLAVRAPTPLPATVAPGALEARDDADLELAWPPADPDARVRLTLIGPNRGHGTPVIAAVECDVADVGRVPVDAALIAGLPPSREGYCAGYDCPDSSLIRYRRAVTESADGLVELVVGGAVELRLVHNPDQVID